jgi:hypothetical protein
MFNFDIRNLNIIICPQKFDSFWQLAKYIVICICYQKHPSGFFFLLISTRLLFILVQLQKIWTSNILICTNRQHLEHEHFVLFQGHQLSYMILDFIFPFCMCCTIFLPDKYGVFYLNYSGCFFHYCIENHKKQLFFFTIILKKQCLLLIMRYLLN